MFLLYFFLIGFFLKGFSQEERPIRLAGDKFLEVFVYGGTMRGGLGPLIFNHESNFTDDCFKYLKNKVSPFYNDPAGLFGEYDKADKEKRKKGIKSKEKELFRYGNPENNTIETAAIIDFLNKWDLKQFNLNDATLKDITLIKILTIFNCYKEEKIEYILNEKQTDLNLLQSWYLSFLSFIKLLRAVQGERAYHAPSRQGKEDYITYVNRTNKLYSYDTRLRFFADFTLLFLEKSKNDNNTIQNYTNDISFYLTEFFKNNGWNYMIQSREKLRVIYPLRNNGSFKGLYNQILTDYKKDLEKFKPSSYFSQPYNSNFEREKIDLQTLKNELFWKFEPQDVRNKYFQKIIAVMALGGTLVTAIIGWLHKKNYASSFRSTVLEKIGFR